MRKTWTLAAAAAQVAAGCSPWVLGRDEHLRKQEIAKHTAMAEIHEAAGNYEGAADEYRAIIELSPQLAEAYQGLGNSLNKLGRFAEAAEAYRKAVTLDPDVYSYRFNLGVTLGRCEKYNEAAAELEKAAALKPEAAEPYIYWGSALRDAGDYKGAVATLARALVIEPNNTLALLNLALAQEYDDAARAAATWRRVRDAADVTPAWHALADEHLAALGAAP